MKAYHSKQYVISPDMPADKDICFICYRKDFIENMRQDKDGFFVHRECEGRNGKDNFHR